MALSAAQVTAQNSTQNSTTAQAVAGAHASGGKKAKTDFSDALNAFLSAGQTPQQPTAIQDNAAPPTTAETPASQAMAALQGNPADDVPDPAGGTQTATLQTGVPQAGAKTNAKTAAQSNKEHSAKKIAPGKETARHTATAATTQAKLVSALAKAANAPAKLAGSDGKTAASSDDHGNPATNDAQTIAPQPAPSQTPGQTALVLQAMQSAAPVVTTVATTADAGTTVTSRTMPQLEKAALTNTAQHATHAAPPAAKTEAQALTPPLDAKAASAQSDSNAQSDTGGDKAKDQNPNARALADAAKAPAPAAPQAPSPGAPQPSNVTASTIQTSANVNASDTSTSAAAAGTVGQTTPTPPTTIATTLQVAQQTSTSVLAQQPNIAAFAVSIAAKSRDGQQQFDIRMEPAELGRVDVRLSVDADGKTQAHLTADKAHTLEILQNDKAGLERSLRDSGIDLSNNGLNFSLRGQQQNSTPTFNARNRALSISAVQTPDISSFNSSTSTAPGDSRLDIRV